MQRAAASPLVRAFEPARQLQPLASVSGLPFPAAPAALWVLPARAPAPVPPLIVPPEATALPPTLGEPPAASVPPVPPLTEPPLLEGMPAAPGLPLVP